MLRFAANLITEHLASGWVFSEDGGPVEIEVLCNGVPIVCSRKTLPRPDVHAAYPQFPSSSASGFSLEFKALQEAKVITIELLALEGGSQTVIGSRQLLPAAERQNLAEGLLTSAIRPSAFPKDILAIVLSMWPDVNEDDDIADKICTIATWNVGDIAPFSRYVRFLRAILSHFRFVQRYFPEGNPAPSKSAIDILCKQTAPQEMLSISNQLYVLQSYGIVGDFAEFGCFKGYSSAMLSYACSLLGIRMHIFDSFEGLPASRSQYYRKGDFSGGIEEVSRNLDIFGSTSSVIYHRGFFLDSLRVTDVPPLMALWMDVDLEASARDVMTFAHKVDPRGPIFSHECDPQDFTSDGKVIMPERHPDAVIPPILDYFSEIKTPVLGRFIFGNTGAFWREDIGFPVVSNSTLLKIAEAL